MDGGWLCGEVGGGQGRGQPGEINLCLVWQYQDGQQIKAQMDQLEVEQVRLEDHLSAA